MPKKNKRQTDAHDAVFKMILSDPKAARDLLEVHLPETWRGVCDLSTLRLQPGSFVEPDLKKYYSDVLYRVNMTGRESGYIYVTVEHQSSPDRLIGFRMMRYAIAAMQQHITQHKSKTVPVVIPLLFYAGKTSPHPYPVDWLACFDEPELARRLYTQPFPLADITVIPDEALLQHRSVALLSLVMKHIRTRDLMLYLKDIVMLVTLGTMTEEQFLTIINYILQSGEKTQSRAFLEQLIREIPQHEEGLMTIAEQLREEGKLQGIQQGIQQTAESIARNLLASGVPVETVKQATGLSLQQLEQLTH
ncbi:Rpn family recombination-promoting nuclease/putative transposase [Klebsiella sp. PL-2018]|uniref:Rpn family recombination-promoting nuclease/putative transposase n=1 Tax=Klebsiella sp. PL-2018 TaxID=2851540 RepID=UPI001C21C505|nr:Rpn family recombination-promoting nuclease/putative transposase [Klebsiella sp. PL-2018]QXD01001.1 Mobile element protein [Klebsiella sp. PL-2018]